MTDEAMLTDVRYAIGQLKPMVETPTSWSALDRVRRTLDALDRIEEELKRRLEEKR